MKSIDHIEGQWLVVWSEKQPVLIEGREGSITGSIHDFSWYLNKEEAIKDINKIYPNWKEEEEEINTKTDIKNKLKR